MKNYYSSNFKLGILGGGQLGRMLLTETQKFDIHTCVLENSKDAPCAQIANEFIIGDWSNYEDVYNFGKTVDVLTLEIEHINIKALLQLEEEGVKIYPQPKVLQIIQNKGLQKDFYVKNGINTANYQRYASKKDLEKAKLNYPCIWKSDTLGYDGTGVKKLNTAQDLASLPNVSCIIEEVIPFKNELAVIVARNVSGNIKTYPVVEMEFHPNANQVEYVICPARISKEVAEKAQKIALQVTNAFKHVGLLAVELFQTQNDDILVNEVAPRPHNSGHFSIEGSYTNQFEQHIRAVLDLPLGNTENKVASVMVNLVGAVNHIGNVHYKNIEEILKIDGVTPHIYGKKLTKPFRKMGHVTIVNKAINKAREVAEIVKNIISVVSK
ncbi:MAG: 5-(carboxyamino)imidazole ribonucleotide synthase [Flavobacteriaceae bacterium]|nr:5-(carboxyamino)imidazole ribonucleotide synthase [Flavobacteriaceae bacterium]